MTITPRRAVDVDAEPPIACTLGPAEMPDRLRRWRTLLGPIETREPLVDGIRLILRPATDIGEVAMLCQAEQECCAFFRFALTVDARGAALEVRAPSDALPLVHAMFGAQRLSNRAAGRAAPTPAGRRWGSHCPASSEAP